MGHRHKGRSTPQQWIGVFIILVTVLFASAIPGYAWRGGGHKGGGHGFHGGHSWKGHGFHGGHGWGGVRFSIRVRPYWGPYGYPYVYTYPYPPQVYVQPVLPLPVQPPAAPPVWYYCDHPEGYYPYVQQCPGGWRTVPQSPQ
jgi:hypothetical protein